MGELERTLVDARAANAERLVARFRQAGADDVAIVRGPPDGRSFGERVRGLVDGAGAGEAGLVVLGSGSLPLLTSTFARDLVAVARSGEKRALTNSFYSADVIAVGRSSALAAVPDLPSDNALPRWLRGEADFEVGDAGRRWRLAIDLDSPLDVLLVHGPDAVDAALAGAVADRIERVRVVAADATAELVVAGRTSASTLRWLERRTASRTRALVEERGLRAIGTADASRPPRSVLGLLLDERGPAELGAILAELGDAAIVDTRVLLAHRLGAGERAWPGAEDRFASDLLRPNRIRDDWLRDLTASAVAAPIPILLGGHTLVGPGVRLALGKRP